MKSMKRRDFVKVGMIGGGLTLSSLFSTSCSNLDKKSNSANQISDLVGVPRYIAAEVSLKPRIRVEANSAEASRHIASYHKAIAIMRKNPRTIKLNKKNVPNGLSWERQAEIHLNFCPHGGWAFFPWHREYLYRFEEIIRAVSEDQDFALPYWDWAKYPRMPTYCLDKNYKDSFFISSEASRKENQQTNINRLIAQQANSKVIDDIMKITDFEAFMGSSDASGEPEVGPHNGIHVALAGTMATFQSPRDPIFWMHHCNVDRLWAEWQLKDVSRLRLSEIDSRYAGWSNQKLEGFYETNGLAITSSALAKDVLFTADLGYAYDTTKDKAWTQSEFNKKAPVRGPAQEVVRKFKNVAFNAKPINAELSVQDDKIFVTFPKFKNENLARYLDNYVNDPSKNNQYKFTLRVSGVPNSLATGTMLANFFIDEAGNEIHISNYNVFKASPRDLEKTDIVNKLDSIAGIQKSKDATDGHKHRHHESEGSTFIFDYKKLLTKLSEANYRKYPNETKLRVDVTTSSTVLASIQEGSAQSRALNQIDPESFKNLAFKLTVSELVQD